MQEVFEKIIEKLELDEKHTFDGCINKRFAIEIVNQAAAEYNNGWIPCSERLPEDKQTCLVTARIYFTPDHVDEIDNYIGVGIDTYSKQFGWLDTEPIAWQPLPAPYQPTRKNCRNRHENGNCLAVGGFCTAVDDKYCKYQPNEERPKKTNFDKCCESMEAMTQIIDIAKIGWTKEQIMEWLQSEAEE